MNARRAALWLLPLVLALAAVAVAYLGHRHHEDRARTDQAEKVVAAHIAGMFTYDYKSLSADLARDRTWLTDAFAQKYGALVAKTVEPAAAKTKLVTKATVAGSGVVSGDRNQAKVLVFLDVATQSTDLTQPRLTGSRMVVTAKYVGGSWRISAIDPV